MPKTTFLLVGAGGIACSHLRNIFKLRTPPRLTGVVEVSADQREKTRDQLEEAKVPCPPFFDSIGAFLQSGGRADAALICTPHKFHFENAAACLQAGMDVLLEKPMVMNADEARRLIRIRDRTRRLLVVAFPGSLSPAIAKAKAMIAGGRVGRITAISACAHQAWKKGTTGTWRQQPGISGGGFLFDTGSHMVNTVLELAGEDVRRLSASFDNCGTPVEILSSVGGQFTGGAMFSLCADGDSVSCQSRILVMGDKGLLETGIWGERLNFASAKSEWKMQSVNFGTGRSVWETFALVRAGRRANPGPAEVGLRFAKFMDMARASAATGRTVCLRR
jgi:predicted dehydrogenase